METPKRPQNGGQKTTQQPSGETTPNPKSIPLPSTTLETPKTCSFRTPIAGVTPKSVTPEARKSKETLRMEIEVLKEQYQRETNLLKKWQAMSAKRPAKKSKENREKSTEGPRKLFDQKNVEEKDLKEKPQAEPPTRLVTKIDVDVHMDECAVSQITDSMHKDMIDMQNVESLNQMAETYLKSGDQSENVVLVEDTVIRGETGPESSVDVSQDVVANSLSDSVEELNDKMDEVIASEPKSEKKAEDVMKVDENLNAAQKCEEPKNEMKMDTVPLSISVQGSETEDRMEIAVDDVEGTIMESKDDVVVVMESEECPLVGKIMAENTVAVNNTESTVSRGLSESQNSFIPETQFSQSAPSSDNSGGYVGGSERSQSSVEAKIVRRARPSRACKRRRSQRVEIDEIRSQKFVFPNVPILAIQTRMDHFALPDDEYAIMKLEKMVLSNAAGSLPKSEDEELKVFDHAMRIEMADVLSSTFWSNLNDELQFLVISKDQIELVKYENSQWSVFEFENDYGIRKVRAMRSNSEFKSLALCCVNGLNYIREFTVDSKSLKPGKIVHEFEKIHEYHDFAVVAENIAIVLNGENVMKYFKDGQWKIECEKSEKNVTGLVAVSNCVKVFVIYTGSEIQFWSTDSFKILKKFNLDMKIGKLFAVNYDAGYLFLTLLSDAKLSLIALNCANSSSKVLIDYDVTDFDDVMVMSKYLVVVKDGVLGVLNRFDCDM